MTEQQLKAIDLTTDEGKQELSGVAGGVLNSEHIMGGCSHFRGYEYEYCIKCKSGSGAGNCPIPLTWQEAMKHFNKATEKHGRNMFDVIEQMYRETTLPMVYSKVEVLSWFLYKAQPERYLMAAVRCEYRSWPRLFFDGEGCNHKGCQNHISHPCEECGRTAAKGEIRSKGDS